MTSTLHRPRWITNPAVLLGTAVLAVAVVWVTAPLWMPREPPVHGRFVWPRPREAVQIRMMTALSAAWLFFFGACVGSFLNVVVWRLPRRESLIWRASRCPRCGAGIRPTDNVPVFGWLKLRGRCRNCQAPISARYPLVELFAGALFLAIAIPELFYGGANLPVPMSFHPRRSLLLIFEVGAPIAAVYAYHCLLPSVLLSWTLIHRDREPIPAGYAVLTGWIGLLAPLAAAMTAWTITGGSSALMIARFMHPVPGIMHAVPGFQATPEWLWHISTLVQGLLGGAAIGMLLTPAARGASPSPRLISALGLIGLFLGWQAAVSVGLLSAVLLLLAAVGCGKFAGRWLLGAVLLAFLLQVLGWRRLEHLGWWPGSATTLAGMVSAGFVIFMHATLAGRMIDAARPRALP